MPRKSVLDLLDEFPSCALPFEAYLDLLPPLRPRYYSISSSPLVCADICSITVGVRGGARAQRPRGVQGRLLELPGRAADRCHGVRLHPQAHDSVSPAREPAPADDHGRARHRRRAVPRLPPGARGAEAAGVPVGESMLFFGCRDPLQDFLYEDELRAFEAAGVTRLFPAFSREPGKPKTYVQQAIKEQSAGRVAAAAAGGGDLRLRRRLAAWRRTFGRRLPAYSRSRPAPRPATPRPGSPGWWLATATSRTSGRPITPASAMRPSAKPCRAVNEKSIRTGCLSRLLEFVFRWFSGSLAPFQISWQLFSGARV